MSQDRAFSGMPKACTNCRIRKIRCDKKVPCSSCQTSGIVCQVSGKAGDWQLKHEATVDPTTEIRQLSENMERIEHSLQRLLLISERQEATAAQGTRKLPLDPNPTAASSPALYEGVSSFTNQAIIAGEASEMLARDFVQLAAAQDGLKSLRTVLQGGRLNAQSSPVKSSAAPTPQSNPEIHLLPSDFVVQLLQHFKANPSIAMMVYCFGDIREVESMCRSVYFPTDLVTNGTLTRMHGLLFHLIDEVSIISQNPLNSLFDIETMKRQCNQNFESGLLTYEIYTNPSVENAGALAIASSRAWEGSDLSRAWHLNACAARQVLALGLHRQASYVNFPDTAANDRRRLFWQIYAWDKNLALRLGQTPCIHDYDMDAEMYSVSRDPKLIAWERAALSFVKFAQLEGQVYDQLYSISALKKGAEERAESTRRLAQAFQRWHDEDKPPISTECYAPEIYELIYGTSDVLYYSHLTTVHVNPPHSGSGTITDACYQAAKRSIDCHLEAFPRIHAWGVAGFLQSYVNWNLLYGAFTPLMVVFLHAISTSTIEDVDLLQSFHASLDLAGELSEEAVRLRRASSIFLSVARAYVESRTQDEADNTPEHPELYAVNDQHDVFSVPRMISTTNIDPSWDATYRDETLRFVEHWMEGEQNAMEYLSMNFDTN